jgi:hypothetical protein
LTDLVAGQSKLLDQISKKVVSNDKVLENINSRMDTFTSAIKNQHSFNKILESQLAQLAAAIPPLEKGKILDLPDDLETTNLIDIHNAANYYIQPAEVKWIDYSLPDKKGDPGRPVIPISIGCHVFPEAVCDFDASVNIMSKVIYEKILGNPLLYINMRLHLSDQSICYPKGVLEEAIVHVGQSYVPVDFVVVKTGGDERALIILGRPFLCITKAIIYTEHAKIVFCIKDKRSSHSRNTSCTPRHTHRYRTYLKSQQHQHPRKRTIENGGGTSSAKC